MKGIREKDREKCQGRRCQTLGPLFVVHVYVWLGEALDIEHLFESCSDLDSIKAPGHLFLMEQFPKALGHSVKTM